MGSIAGSDYNISPPPVKQLGDQGSQLTDFLCFQPKNVVQATEAPGMQEPQYGRCAEVMLFCCLPGLMV